jgi:hypothetical protein
MVDQPTVDVVVATRGNRPELLGTALEAIWNQTYSGRVVCTVVFDHVEPDRSLERTDERRTIQVTTNTHAQGLAGARNSGVDAGTGAFIATTTTSGCRPSSSVRSLPCRAATR